MTARVVLFATLALAACSGSPTGVSGAIKSVTIVPAETTLAVGGTRQLRMDVETGPGPIPPLPSPVCSSANAAVATVDPSGTVTAKTVGQAIVQVQFGGKTATSRVTVEP